MNGRTWESIDWIHAAFQEKGEFSHKGATTTSRT